MSTDYEPFYCDAADKIVHGQRDSWGWCPLCGSRLSEELREALQKPPLVPHGPLGHSVKV